MAIRLDAFGLYIRRRLGHVNDLIRLARQEPVVVEFPRLGQAPAGGGSRVYRQADIEMVLRIKSLVFGEGLTLAGARRRLEEMTEPEAPPLVVPRRDGLGEHARERVRTVRDGLRDLLHMLSNGEQAELVLTAAPAKRASKAKRKAS